jgi:hypothetical protein
MLTKSVRLSDCTNKDYPSFKIKLDLKCRKHMFLKTVTGVFYRYELSFFSRDGFDQHLTPSLPLIIVFQVKKHCLDWPHPP